MRSRNAAVILAALALVLPNSAAQCAEQLDLEQGIFFEAEDYDQRPWWGDAGFATIHDEPLGSGGKVLVGMYQPGAVAWAISAPSAGDYQVWLRCAVPGDTSVKLGANVQGDADMRSAPVEATTSMAGLAGSGAYGWRNLGTVALVQGENSLVLGQGPLRPDCFLLTLDAGLAPTDDLLAEVARIREAPKGQLLPELTHDREITSHPRWLAEAWRASYAHLEWDADKATPEQWCARAREAGATVIVGAGEMPAGSLDGAMKTFPFARIDDPNFALPEGYLWDHGWTKQFVDGAHQHGLKMVLYDGAHRTLDPILLEHPEWRQRYADGRVYQHGFGSWHSPYRQAWIDRWVQVARLSGMDGIMIDMMFTCPAGGDYSEYTVAAFRERFGVEPPRTADPRDLTWQRWMDFQAWSREEALLDLTEALHQVNPEIAVIPNQTAGWIFDGMDRNFLRARAARCCDGFLEEMGWEFQSRRNRPWAWPLHAQFQNLLLHCRTRPGWANMWCLTHNFPDAHNQSLNYTMFANGAAPGVVTGGNWPEMTEVWRHIEACEPAMRGASLQPWLALHFGEDTLYWYANTRGQEVYDRWLLNLFGLFQAALELHLPIEIIGDDELADPAALTRYATVLLPTSACLSDAQAQALDQYVQSGGGLVATGESGCFDENGTRLETSRLAGIIGATQHPAQLASAWRLPLTALDHPLVDHPDIRGSGSWDQGQSNPRTSGVLYAGAREIAAAPLTGIAPDCFSLPLIGGPKGSGEYRLLAREHGQGKVVYFPLEIGHAYYVWNHPLNRRLIGQAATWTASRPCPLTTNAPMIVQTVLWQTPDTRLVHLLNDISSFGRAAAPNPEAYTAFRAEVIPIHDVKVTVAGDFAQARLLPAGDELPVTHEDGRSGVVVPRLDIHAVVVFSP